MSQNHHVISIPHITTSTMTFLSIHLLFLPSSLSFYVFVDNLPDCGKHSSSFVCWWTCDLEKRFVHSLYIPGLQIFDIHISGHRLGRNGESGRSRRGYPTSDEAYLESEKGDKRIGGEDQKTWNWTTTIGGGWQFTRQFVDVDIKKGIIGPQAGNIDPNDDNIDQVSEVIGRRP